ncbi:MAG: hypothetical protein P1Q69_10490 [Candidatus Thorarchaeota archaeon]|nr:hypothetical protein [Candidatus Thorarchaeota archaeon]
MRREFELAPTIVEIRAHLNDGKTRQEVSLMKWNVILEFLGYIDNTIGDPCGFCFTEEGGATLCAECECNTKEICMDVEAYANATEKDILGAKKSLLNEIGNLTLELYLKVRQIREKIKDLETTSYRDGEA